MQSCHQSPSVRASLLKVHLCNCMVGWFLQEAEGAAGCLSHLYLGLQLAVASPPCLVWLRQEGAIRAVMCTPCRGLASFLAVLH